MKNEVITLDSSQITGNNVMFSFFITIRFMGREYTEISTNHKPWNTSRDRVSTNHKPWNTSRDRVSTNHTVVHSTWQTLYFTWESSAAKWFNFLFTTTDTLHITRDTHDTRASVSTVLWYDVYMYYIASTV